VDEAELDDEGERKGGGGKGGKKPGKGGGGGKKPGMKGGGGKKGGKGGGGGGNGIDFVDNAVEDEVEDVEEADADEDVLFLMEVDFEETEEVVEEEDEDEEAPVV